MTYCATPYDDSLWGPPAAPATVEERFALYPSAAQPDSGADDDGDYRRYRDVQYDDGNGCDGYNGTGHSSSQLHAAAGAPACAGPAFGSAPTYHVPWTERLLIALAVITVLLAMGVAHLWARLSSLRELVHILAFRPTFAVPPQLAPYSGQR